jgi:hypothetical protein
MGWIMGLKRKVWILKPDRFLTQSGSTLWILVVLILIPLTGCASLDLFAPPPTNSPVPTRTKVVFPPTWTELPPTSTATTSTRPSPTITPTPTATPYPAESNQPTLISPAPNPTTDWNAVSLPDCIFTAAESGVRINPAPFIDPYHVLPTMEPGKPYPAVLTKPTYTLLLEDGQPLGWVDYRLLALTSEGNDCLTKYDQRELWDFPLCFFTPLTEINGYADSEFTEALHTLVPPTSLVVLYQSESYYFTAYGSSGPSFVVKKEEVTTHGKCDDIPTLAKATNETSLYSDLPDRGGSMIYTLAADESIFTQSQRRDGSPPPGAEGSGYWILARKHSWSEDINGWVWSGQIEYK